MYFTFKAVGSLLNQFGQVAFLAPSLYLNLRRAVQGKSCLCLCSNVEFDERDTTDAGDTNISLDDNVNNLSKQRKTRTSETSRTSKSSICLIIRRVRNRIRKLLKSKKTFYLLTFSIGVYGLFNLVVCSLKFHVGIPIVEILPKESYMRKHMINHLELFELAPIINVAFLKPIEYWNATQFHRIRAFLDDVKSVKGMDRRFEWNWLQEVYDMLSYK